MNYSFALRVVRIAFVLLAIVFIVGVFLLLLALPTQLEVLLSLAFLGPVYFPLKMYTVRDRYEESSCDFCGWPIYKGDTYFTDEFYTFCCIDHGHKYSQLVPVERGKVEREG